MFGSKSPKSEGTLALQALDRALAHKPKRVGEDFSAATEHLCQMRDLLIAESRKGGGDQSRLGRVNAILSSALSGHFPLGKTPWPEVEKARDSLKELIAEV